MRIRRLELTNFRTFGHAVFEDIPQTVLLVSPNGRGKSSVLEAIAGAHDLVVPYHQDNYPFLQLWQKRHVSVWPSHLPDPIKIGERTAVIEMEVHATGREVGYLAAAGVTSTVGTVVIRIEDSRHVSEITANDVVKRLFQYHNPSEGVGFLDYISPVRFYRSLRVGNFAADMSDEMVRRTLSEFHLNANEHAKFSGFKSFVISSQLSDMSRLQSTGEVTDSLARLRMVFDNFFAPKRFIGYRTDESGEPKIVVASPFGDHDTDALSAGEKEVLNILCHLFRFHRLNNVVLWDTPELHLNAALESRLHAAFRAIAPDNQYWIATHSLELINSVPLENVFIIRQDGKSAAVERASGEDRRVRVGIYREMGAQVGLQLVSNVVAFCEGKEATTDKLILDRVVAPLVPGVNFIAGGSCENILAAGTRANRLLQDACSNGDFFVIADRDYRDDGEVRTLLGQYNGRLFLWGVHEIENVFLDPVILHQTLEFLGRAKEFSSPEAVETALKAAAISLTDWIAADWVAWEFDRTFRPPSRRISGQDPKGSLLKYTESLKAKVLEATEVKNVEERNEQKREAIRVILSSDEWRSRLPGKQLLGAFLSNVAPPLSAEDYLRVASGLVQERGIQIPEFERLKETLGALPSVVPK